MATQPIGQYIAAVPLAFPVRAVVFVFFPAPAFGYVGLSRAHALSLKEPSRYALLSGLYALSVGLLVHQFFESYLYQGLPLFLLAIIPLQALLREPARLYRLREPVWKGQEAAWFYRRAS